jgi:ribosomal-protein-alanine N-acetyltransferase
MRWPVTLRHGPLLLRPLTVGDARAWRDLRSRNAVWLRQWEATMPPDSGARPTTFRSLVRRLGRMARDGHALPFAIEVDGEFAGQITVNNIVLGSARFCSVGYWIGEEYAGRGLVPLAVAMVIDHLFLTERLHRVEIAIRPENTNSLRVVEKLGIQRCGLAPRYLHIDGAWRDHVLFGITAEEVPGGLVRRLLNGF